MGNVTAPHPERKGPTTILVTGSADALVELFAERRKGKEADGSPVAETILGRPATSFDRFAAPGARPLAHRAFIIAPDGSFIDEG